MIDKPSIVITSLGRTGTKFFQELFADIIPDATSLHEPDYLNFGQYHGISERFRQLVRQMQESGFSNLIIRKALGKWSLITISDARLRGTLGYSEAVEQGRHRETAPIGLYFAKLWYYERLYPLTFAVSALGQAVRRLAGSEPKDTPSTPGNTETAG